LELLLGEGVEITSDAVRELVTPPGGFAGAMDRSPAMKREHFVI